MLSKKLSTMFLSVIVLLFATAVVVFAAGHDLSAVGSQTTINGAIFEAISPGDPTGSGTFDAFLRTQASPSEKGFNSDLKNSEYEFDEVGGCCTHSITLAEVPQITVQSSGITYRIFELDINESGSFPENYLTLDLVQIFEAPSPTTCGYPFDGSVSCPDASNTATMVYNMDASENSFVVLDYNNNPGSGKRDMRLWVPDSLFSQDPNCAYPATNPNLCTDYIILYNEFGKDFDAQDSNQLLQTAHASGEGFEEWGVPLSDLPTAISLSDFGITNSGSEMLAVAIGFVMLLVVTTFIVMRRKEEAL